MSSLDDDAADALRPRIDGVQRGLALLDDAELRDRWLDAVAAVAAQRGVHGLVAGRLNRLALDAGRIDRAIVADRLARVLSRSAEAPRAAAWLDGFLAGDAALLLHDRDLLGIVDEWVAGIAGDRFDDVLPLLRRTFSAFAPAERRQLGERLRRAPARSARRRRGRRRWTPSGRPGSCPGSSSCWGWDMTDMPDESGAERLRRWRLVLGGGEADGTGVGLEGDDAAPGRRPRRAVRPG